MSRHASIFRRALLLAVGCPGIAAAATPADVAAQDVAPLEAAARAEAARHLPPLTPHQRLEVGSLRAAAAFDRCQQPIESSVAPGVAMNGRVMVELRCNAGARWHLYVPVKVIGTTPVVITTHALVAGTPLTARDLRVEERDAVGLPPGYLNSADIAVGLTASRAVSQGEVLTNQELLGTRAVQRGQEVTLVASDGTISVRMAGRALSDGFINQRVRALNLSSGRIVEGVARSDQVIEINLQ